MSVTCQLCVAELRQPFSFVNFPVQEGVRGQATSSIESGKWNGLSFQNDRKEGRFFASELL